MKDNFTTLQAAAKSYLDACGDQQGVVQVEEIGRQHLQDPYRVCIVGGFSRGKTRLVNALLNTDIFLETATPTTTVLTEIARSAEPGLVFESNGKSTQHPLNRESLRQFSVGGAQADAAGILRVRVADSWLPPTLYLYDTPGIDDVLTRRANVTFGALENSDAALVVVSAVSPLGLHEKAFVDSYLTGRAITRLAIVITFLDKVPEDERAAQIAYTATRARSWYPDIEIWCAQDLAEAHGLCSVVGPQAIRARLAEWTNMPDILDLREKRDRARLKLLVETALLRRQTLLENLRGDVQARQEELKQARLALEESNGTWKDIRSDFEAKALATSEAIEEEFGAFSRELSALLRQEADESLETALRLRLQQGFAAMGAHARERVNNDVRALFATMQEHFGLHPEFTAAAENPAGPTALELPQAEDNGWGPLVDMLADGLEALLDFVPQFLPQAWKKAAEPLVLLGRQACEWLRGLASNEGSRREQLETVVPEICSTMAQKIRIAVKQTYNEVADYVRQQQQTWLEEQQKELQKPQDNREQEITALARLVDEGSALATRLKG